MEGEERKPKSKLKIVLYSIFGVFLTLFFVIEGSLLTQKFIMHSPAPNIMGYSTFIVTTGSMNGTINEGDMIIIKKTNDYKLGDIITFIEKEGAVPTTHRIVNYGDKEGTYITKGDANPSKDRGQISEDQILGEVVFVIAGVGIFFGWVSSENGWVYIAVIVAIFAGMIYLLTRKPDETDEKEV